jgi:hypothetical protein
LARYYYTILPKLLINRKLVVITEDNNRYTACDLAKGSDYIIKAFNNKEPGFYIYKDYIILL